MINYDEEDLGEIDNEEEPIQEDDNDFNYEEDLMGEEEKSHIPKQQKRVTTPYVKKEQVMEEEVIDDNDEQYDQYQNDEEEEGEVYQYESEDDQQQPQQEYQQKQQTLNNENEYDEEDFEDDQYHKYDEDEYEEIEDNDNQQKEQKSNQDQSQDVSKQKGTPKPIPKRPPKPSLPKKQTYQEKYADFLKQQDYSKWTLKQLMDQNKELRIKLKEFSDEVTKMLEEDQKIHANVPLPQKKTEIKHKRPKAQPSVLIDKEIEINNKKIEQQEDELNRLEYRKQQLEDPEFLKDLDQKQTELEKKIKSLQSHLKQEQLKQKQKGKDLEKYEIQDGLDKLKKEKQNKLNEAIQWEKKVKEKQEQIQQLNNLIQGYKTSLPQIDEKLKEVQEEAYSLKIDINNNQPFTKQKENYAQLLAQKEQLQKHINLMEKKKQQLKMVERDIAQYRKDQEFIEKDINQIQMNLIEQKQVKEQLKNKVPASLFKQIPASMTQENISQTIQEENQKILNSRKLQSAKPPIPQGQKEEVRQTKKQEDQQSRVEEELNVDEEIQEDNMLQKNAENPFKQQKQETPQKQELVLNRETPPKQNKLNSKPFMLGKKQVNNNEKEIQIEEPQEAQTNNNQVDNSVNNTSNVSAEYQGPSRMMRMMRRPQNNNSEQNNEYQLTQIEQVKPQNDIIKPSEFQKPIDPFEKIQDDYQPVFQTRRNRMKQNEDLQQSQPKEPPSDYIITVHQGDANKRRKHNILEEQNQELKNETQQDEQMYPRRRQRGSEFNYAQIEAQGKEEEIPQNNQKKLNLFTQKTTPQEQPKKEFIIEQPKQEFIIQQQKEQEKEQPKEPIGYGFQPQQLGGAGRRNRNPGRINILDEQPKQKENIQEITDIREIKEVKEVREQHVEYQQQPKYENKEMTLEEILGGGRQQTQEEQVPQKKKFEVPQDDDNVNNTSMNYPSRRMKQKNREDEQKKLALQAEKNDLFDDFF